MLHILFILILSITSFSLSACHNVPMWKYSMFERPSGNQPYPPLYIKGWKDGCESGADASANYFYKTQYQFKQDWRLLSEPYYVRGWEDSYNHCRKYVLQHNLAQL